MEKYTIKENRPDLTKAEVEQGMDFDKIMHAATHRAKTFRLGRYLAVGIAAAVIATLAVYWPSLTGSDQEEAPRTVAMLPNEANVPDTFVVNTIKDTLLVHTSGTRIRIPANAFINEKGEPVSGSVKINYREFHKVSEILLANIPMRYDSGGKEMYFESAGMFDISAQQAEKPVYIARDKSLEVSLASLDKREGKFNQYYFDKKSGHWQFLKTDNVTVVEKPDTIVSIATRTDSVLKTAPRKPTNERMFTIDGTGRPELDMYKNIVFEVTPDCKTFNPEEARTDWGMVQVEKIAKSEKFKVTFSYPFNGPMRTYAVTARPVKDDNMAALMQQYGDLYAAYKKKLKEAQLADQAAEDALKKEAAMYEDVFDKYQRLQEANARLYAAQAGLVNDVSQVVYRTFQVREFGIWNSDCPSSMPQGVEVFARFEAASGEGLKVAAVYLIEKGRNAMFNLYVPKSFSFNPDAENVLLVITNNGKLGYVKNDVFNLITSSTKNFTFKVNLIPREKYTLADIDSIVS